MVCPSTEGNGVEQEKNRASAVQLKTRDENYEIQARGYSDLNPSGPLQKSYPPLQITS